MKVIGLVILLLFSLYVGSTINTINEKASHSLSPACRTGACAEVGPSDQRVSEPIPAISDKKETVSGNATGKVWVGKVSHYSRAGCLGCSPTLTMANGETLSDERATIAFNQLPMNTKVLVTNLDNGRSIEALVTDTGGFESLGRIADLTPAVANYLETKTDISEVRIYKLEE